jgi:hypothetical protein
MSYHHDQGYHQNPQPGPQPPPPADGARWGPQPYGPNWNDQQSPRRRMVLIVTLISVVVAAVVVTTVLLTNGGGNSSWRAGTPLAVPVPTESSSAGEPSDGPAADARPLPPPTPTGEPYQGDDPAIGACVDVARKPTGVSIYPADCGDPGATLILDSVQTEKCPAKGFFGLNSLSRKVLCFTYNFQVGDCIDMAVPRRASCDVAPNGKPRLVVADIRAGQQDGTGCSTPTLFLQVGKQDERGVACLGFAASPSGPAQPSR